MRGTDDRAVPVLTISILVGLWLMLPADQAAAQALEIRFARQFSMGYLQFNLMQRHQLVEKHARMAGIPEPKWCGQPSIVQQR
jgi:hypothetical protein